MPADVEDEWTPDLLWAAARRRPVRRRTLGALVLVLLVVVGSGAVVATLGWTPVGLAATALGALGLLVLVVAGLIVLDRHLTSRWSGDDLLQIALAPAGVTVQGGLRVRWSEISGVTVVWGKGTTTLRGAGGAGVRLGHRAMELAGHDRTEKAVHVHLADDARVRARATTRPRRAVLVSPTLGAPAFVLALLQERTEAEMRQLLRALDAYGRRHAFEVVQREP